MLPPIRPALGGLCVPPRCPSKRSGDGRSFLPEVQVRREAGDLERPVSRVLSPRRVAPAREKVIPLGRPLLDGSSTLTRTPHPTEARRSGGPPSTMSLFELAPGWACPAAGHPAVARELLPHDFTLTCVWPPLNEESRTIGGVVSAALSLESPRVGVTDLPVLWSPDFPPVNLRWRTGDLPAAFGGRPHPIAGRGPGHPWLCCPIDAV